MLLKNELELNVYGHEKCRPGKSFGPALRDYYLFHYIKSGRGIFEVNKKKYDLQQGQMFAICPGDVTYYKADDSDPWEYNWIGFSSKEAEEIAAYTGIDAQDPIREIPGDSRIPDILEELSVLFPVNKPDIYRSISLLYDFIAELTRSFAAPPRSNVPSDQNIYIEAVKKYIGNNYQNNISVAQIASRIGLNRSYLGTLFKKSTEKSIQEYLIEYRLRRAMSLVRDTELGILEISNSVGYADQFAFSRAFKKKFGISPSKARDKSAYKC